MITVTHCDIVIYNKYILSLCPLFWHRAPKTLWNLLRDESKKESCYVHEVTLGTQLKMGAVARKTNSGVIGLELSVSLP